MDMKILAAALAVSLLAFAGIAFAMPGGHRWAGNGTNGTMPPCFGGQNGTQPWENGEGPAPPWENGTWNSTRPSAPWQDENWNGTMPDAPPWQGAKNGGHGIGNSAALANFTEHMQEFLNVVLNGDYAAAKRLHEEYGVGSPVFGKLNETTFAKYSQIQKLQRELSQELGLNETIGMGPLGQAASRESLGLALSGAGA